MAKMTFEEAWSIFEKAQPEKTFRKVERAVAEAFWKLCSDALERDQSAREAALLRLAMNVVAELRSAPRTEGDVTSGK